jgi:hypothetical protein
MSIVYLLIIATCFVVIPYIPRRYRTQLLIEAEREQKAKRDDERLWRDVDQD